MTAGLIGRDPNVNVLRRFRYGQKAQLIFAYYGDCNAILLFTSWLKISTSFCFRDMFGHVFSYIKKNGLSQYQTRINNSFLIRSGIL